MPDCFLPNTDPELQRAWRQFPDPVMEDQATGECLQYMGTVLRWDGHTYQHEFRHRCLPTTQKRTSWLIPAAEGWQPPLTKKDM